MHRFLSTSSLSSRVIQHTGTAPRNLYDAVMRRSFIPSFPHSSSSSSSPSSPTLTPSVVETALEQREIKQSARAFTEGALPIKLAENETLLYVSGNSTQRTVLVSWVGATTCSLYLAAAKGAEVIGTSQIELLSTGWTAVFGAVAALTLFLAQATTNSCVKYAVLAADGAHLRVYPYSALPWRFRRGGTPVELPIPLLRLNTSFAVKKKDAAALHVKVNESKAHLIFDKPVGLGLPTEPGTGLVWDRDGVTGIAPPNNNTSTSTTSSSSTTTTPPPAAAANTSSSSSSIVAIKPMITTDALGLLDKTTRATFRRYAVLTHVLEGNCVDAQKVARSIETELHGGAGGSSSSSSTKFSLEKLKQVLKPTDEAYRSLWKHATDAQGRQYWYHEVTWQRQWLPPSFVANPGGVKL